MAISINSSLSVGAGEDSVVIWSSDACDENGSTLPGEAHLILSPAEAIALARALTECAFEVRARAGQMEAPNA